MAKASELVAWAQSQIGVKESPANSNIVKYWDSYKARCGVNLQGAPWCAAFVTDGMCTVGAWKQTTNDERFRYCPSLVTWAKNNGQWLDRSATCQPGDIVLFANGSTACHVGIVEKRIDASTIQTIEGNTSVTSNDNGGAVMRRTRAYGTVGSSWYVLGFIRTPWSTSGGTTSSGSSTNIPTITASTGKGKKMECIFRPNDENYLVYYDGTDLHKLSHPDEVTAIQTVYKNCTGKDIPMFELGTKKAPWATRFIQAVQRGLSKF